MNASARPSNKVVRKGLAHLNAGRIDDAERLFRSVLKSEPDNPDANHALGTLAVRQGNLPLALRFLTAALQANPREARHWLSFAEALLQSGSIGDARAVIEKAAVRFSGPRSGHCGSRSITASSTSARSSTTGRDASPKPNRSIPRSWPQIPATPTAFT
jgi:tetratricopeptide (TPR) repeat protein